MPLAEHHLVIFQRPRAAAAFKVYAVVLVGLAELDFERVSSVHQAIVPVLALNDEIVFSRKCIARIHSCLADDATSAGRWNCFRPQPLVPSNRPRTVRRRRCTVPGHCEVAQSAHALWRVILELAIALVAEIGNLRCVIFQHRQRVPVAIGPRRVDRKPDPAR